MKIAIPDLISNSYFPAAAAVALGLFKEEGRDMSLDPVFPVDRTHGANLFDMGQKYAELVSSGDVIGYLAGVGARSIHCRLPGRPFRDLGEKTGLHDLPRQRFVEEAFRPSGHFDE